MVFMTTLNDRSKTIPEARAAAAGPVSISAAALAEHLSRPGQPPHLVLDALIADGLGRPPPGHGATLERWRMLAMVAAYGLSLAKLYEGHTDAMAILSELAGRLPAAGSSKTQPQENEMDVPLLIQVARRGRGAGGGGS